MLFYLHLQELKLKLLKTLDFTLTYGVLNNGFSEKIRPYRFTILCNNCPKRDLDAVILPDG